MWVLQLHSQVTRITSEEISEENVSTLTHFTIVSCKTSSFLQIDPFLSMMVFDRQIIFPVSAIFFLDLFSLCKSLIRVRTKIHKYICMHTHTCAHKHAHTHTQYPFFQFSLGILCSLFRACLLNSQCNPCSISSLPTHIPAHHNLASALHSKNISIAMLQTVPCCLDSMGTM